MTSTWSNLGLNLQGTGDNSGTWGQLTNVNLQDIDTAISGVAPITLTGNTTLAFTSNSSSTTFTNYPGLNKIIVLSGSLSATTVTVTVPNIQKDYVIVNNSGATVVVSSGGSTTISIPTSTNAYIYSNGSSSIFFALPLPTVTSAGGTTNQVQYNNAGAFAGSTNLTFNGTTLAMQTATVLNLTSTTENITTANVTTANITSLTAVNTTTTSLAFTTATGTTATISGINATTLNINSGGIIKIYNTATSQYTGLQVAAGAATSQTFTLPSADGTSGQFLKTNGSGVLSFAGVNAITWQSVQTTNFNATAGNGYPVNTNSASVTVTLPSSPSAGNIITVTDYAGTFGTNNLIINSNGSKINNSGVNAIVATNRESIQLVYVDSTQGWLLYGGFNTSTPAQPISATYLVVGGGGAGGTFSNPTNPGAGGAGGYLTGTTNLTKGTTYTVTVGGAGSPGGTGGYSLITNVGGTAFGGGGGGNPTTGISGGSGGGGGASATNYGGGSGTAGQGNNGGSGISYYFGAGGGAGGAGGNGSPGIAGGTAGAGSLNSITGTSTTYAMGYGSNSTGTPANTGFGGAPGNPGTNGASGVVILSVPTNAYSGTVTGTYTTATNGSNTVITFTGSGSYTA